MRYTITRQRIEVLGKLWMPGCDAAMVKDLSPYDVANLGDLRDRDAVLDWLGANTGDFSSITDFRADFTVDDEPVIHEWQDEESEWKYNDCMFPSEDE